VITLAVNVRQKTGIVKTESEKDCRNGEQGETGEDEKRLLTLRRKLTQ
jgi:hypothetical protein